MIHKMNLHDKPFQRIKNGTKTVELRLNDEKRQLLKKDDLIEFANRVTNEIITVRVVDLHHYSSFDELYKHFDKVAMGYDIDETANPSDMEEYYSHFEQEKYGVLGIEIKVVEENKLGC